MRYISRVLMIVMAMMLITTTAYAAPVVTSADCETITVQIGEDIPEPQIPFLYAVTVAIADGDRTWELGAQDTITVDRSWPGSAWAVWVNGDLHSTGERDTSCVWDYEIVVDTDKVPTPTVKPVQTVVQTPPLAEAVTPAGVRPL